MGGGALGGVRRDSPQGGGWEGAGLWNPVQPRCYIRRARPPAQRTSCPASSPPWRPWEPKRWRTSLTTSRCPSSVHATQAGWRGCGQGPWGPGSGTASESRPPSGAGLPCREAGWPCCQSPVSTRGPPFLSQGLQRPHGRHQAPVGPSCSLLCPLGCPDTRPPGGGAVGPQAGAQGGLWACLGDVSGTQAVSPTERPRQGVQHAQGWHRARAHEQRRCCRGSWGAVGRWAGRC